MSAAHDSNRLTHSEACWRDAKDSAEKLKSGLFDEATLKRGFIKQTLGILIFPQIPEDSELNKVWSLFLGSVTELSFQNITIWGLIDSRSQAFEALSDGQRNFKK